MIAGRAGDLPRPRRHQLDQPGERARASSTLVLPLAREHGAAVVALTIDEEGMAKTAEKKLAVAKRIHDIAVRRVRPARRQALLFDALTFPVTTGQEELRDSARADARRHPPHQGRAARRADHPGRQQRLLRRRASTRAPCSTASSSTTPSRPGSTPPSSTRRTSRPTPRFPTSSARSATTCCSTAPRTPCRASSPTSRSTAACSGRRRSPTRRRA